MKQADRPLTVAQIYWKGRHKLTPLARSIYALIDGMGSITALDAMRAKGVSSGSLTRRITELRDIGLPVVRETHKDPLTGRRYGKWRFAGTSK
ncbi:helix-turn-helix domain-containing protein [Acetobacter sp. UBA5411]|nr:helix-turn-helix domain-containing protein [Acetobacter sp. UBA5411]